MKLNYTPEAISDIEEIKRYIKHTLRNPTAAARISKAVLDTCASLKAFPKMGVSVEGKAGFETDLRMLSCEHWIAVCRVASDSDVVSIARIIDGRQDYMRILFGDMDFGPAMDENESQDMAEDEFIDKPYRSQAADKTHAAF